MNIVSKRWQATNRWVQHAILASIILNVSFWIQLELLPWQKITFLIVSFIPLGVISHFLHKRYANIMVKVFKVEYGELSWLVQRELRSLYIPFIKKSGDEEVQLEIRSKGIAIKVESFPLNMLMDDHLTPVPAAKITVTPIRKEWPFVKKLCAAIDKALLSNPQTAFKNVGA